MPLSLPIVTERLILRLPLLAGMFPKIADADDFDDYMHEHPDLWQLFKNDLDTQKFYEITSQDRFYFSGFRRSGIDANGCKYSEFRDVCEFVWGLCRDLERNPVSGYGLVLTRVYMSLVGRFDCMELIRIKGKLSARSLWIRD